LYASSSLKILLWYTNSFMRISILPIRKSF
jgi:hypothetical protein